MFISTEIVVLHACLSGMTHEKYGALSQFVAIHKMAVAWQIEETKEHGILPKIVNVAVLHDWFRENVQQYVRR